MDGPCEECHVFITVMTYPRPSQKYVEVICTAGITEEGHWVRLYPIDYRYLPPDQQFGKYQWIKIALYPQGASNDMRKESRKPNLKSIRIAGPRVGTEHGWRARKAILEKVQVHSLTELRHLYDTERTSLGFVRPSRVLDLKIQPEDEEWDTKWLEIFKQLPLFGEPPKTLRKIPFKFVYVFECEDSAAPHTASLIDWEMGVLWLKEAERLGDDEAAALSVKRKFFDEICGSDKDTHFFMGTRHPYNTWMVLGVFWPPRVNQMTLF
ncbi:MAG: hypothetical protein HY912_21080 [Desulfomonile tiedjei]|uniref:Uncharacterized protein n=1 Tax=Desulfomonile tiedjei TaxID=2358 RepID=A0A9D6V7G9_9BACT|nr:hypothetical protein [Desulfomonile tiedjei]